MTSVCHWILLRYQGTSEAAASLRNTLSDCSTPFKSKNTVGLCHTYAKLHLAAILFCIHMHCWLALPVLTRSCHEQREQHVFMSFKPPCQRRARSNLHNSPSARMHVERYPTPFWPPPYTDPTSRAASTTPARVSRDLQTEGTWELGNLPMICRHP